VGTLQGLCPLIINVCSESGHLTVDTSKINAYDKNSSTGGKFMNS
jgi:hypothetical protein